jgi:hypothetical protein
VYGCETPRIWTQPLRELTPETSLGFACIAFAEDVCDIGLYPWQKWLLVHALELDPALTVSTLGDRDPLDPIFRFRKIVVLVARQNGKSTLSQVLSLFFLYVMRTGLVLGTAQDLDTAEEVWEGALEIIEETPELAALADKPVRNNGKKAIRLYKEEAGLGTNGERYKVKAANRRAGRGLSADLILLDELREHQTWEAWGAITKTTQARAAAQIWALSNAGDASSVVLRHLRKMAHAALGDPDGLNAADDAAGVVDQLPTQEELDAIAEELDEFDDAGDLIELEEEDFEEDPDTLGIFEWSAPPGADIMDRDGWAQANPSLGYGISERTIAGDAKADPEWTFRTEVLCQWSDAALDGPFPPGSWEQGLDPETKRAEGAEPVFGLDVSVDRRMAHLLVAFRRADGLPSVEKAASRPGTEWVVERHRDADGNDYVTGWFADRATEERPMTVVVQERGAPASALIEDLELVPYLTVVKVGGPNLGLATERMYQLVKGSRLVEIDGAPPAREGLAHLPWGPLDVAAATAVPKILSDGGMAWDRKKSPHDIAPLVAATFAVWRVMQVEAAPPPSAYEDHDLMVV